MKEQTGIYAAYIKDGNGVDGLKSYKTTPTAYSLPMYDEAGQLQTNNPTDSLDAVNKQYFEANGVLSKCIPLEPLEGATEITINQLLALKNGFYYVTNRTIKGWTTDITGYFVLTKTGVAGTNDATIMAQGIGGDLIYMLGVYSSGQKGRGWTRLATTSDITSSFKTIFDQSITGTGSITPYEAYLNWGGKNIAGNFGPVDAALIPNLGANRWAFMPSNAITIEYSRDGGTTWSPYELAAEYKTNLFAMTKDMSQVIIGNDSSTGIDKSKYMVRFTINTGAAGVYTELRKFAIYLSTEGSSGCYCTITGRLQSNVEAGTEAWRTFVDKAGVGGWSGWNILNTYIATYGNDKSVQYGQIRFTFGVESHPSSVNYSGLTIFRILAFGGVGWRAPSTMAHQGEMYSYDWEQNVFFPQSVYANGKKLATEDQLGNYLSKTGITSQAGLTITQTSSGVQVDSAVLIDNSLLGG